MDTEMFISIGVGLIVLGLALVIIDFFIVRLIKKMYPNGLQEIDESPELSNLDSSERQRYESIWSRYYDGVTHRMKRIGLVVSMTGILILGLCGILNLLPK